MKPVVYAVQNEPAVAQSLQSLISAAGWTARVFASRSELRGCPQAQGPSALVVDMDVPGLDALDLQQAIKSRGCLTPIVFLGSRADVPTTVRAMKAGAVDLLMKPYSDEALVGAIREAIGRSEAALRSQEESRAVRDAYESLTPRERDVMELVVSGLLNKQVGGELGISEVTVKAHRGNVMRKMGVRSLAHLVRIAAMLGVSRSPRQPAARQPFMARTFVPFPRRLDEAAYQTAA